MRISTVARKAGVGVETIRFYERKALIATPPKPSNGGFRSYPVETVERIRFIRQAQSLGFSLREIDELLSLRADPSTDCADVRERARAKLSEVNAKIARLTAIRLAIEDLIDACPGKGAVRLCSILEAFESQEINETMKELDV
jgi:MerR family mercuric resistance operon transcriptional regulator